MLSENFDERSKSMKDIKQLREMMKSYTQDDEDFVTDQQLKKEQPPIIKYYNASKRIALPTAFDSVILKRDFITLLQERMSRRNYKNSEILLTEVAFLLWAVQGVREVLPNQKATLRTVPSAGGRHPYETYFYANSVKGLEKGLYHYLPLEHQIEQLTELPSSYQYEDMLTEAFIGQTYMTTAPIMFLWTIIPYRSEYRYAWKSHRCALMDGGCIQENLYLATEAIGCGTCIVAAFDQELADGLLGLPSKPTDDKENEFVIFAAGVGKQE